MSTLKVVISENHTSIAATTIACVRRRRVWNGDRACQGLYRFSSLLTATDLEGSNVSIVLILRLVFNIVEAGYQVAVTHRCNVDCEHRKAGWCRENVLRRRFPSKRSKQFDLIQCLSLSTSQQCDCSCDYVSILAFSNGSQRNCWGRNSSANFYS